MARTDKEMEALLGKFDLQLGSLDKWSEDALEKFNDWLADTSTKVEKEWAKLDQPL